MASSAKGRTRQDVAPQYIFTSSEHLWAKPSDCGLVNYFLKKIIIITLYYFLTKTKFMKLRFATHTSFMRTKSFIVLLVVSLLISITSCTKEKNDTDMPVFVPTAKVPGISKKSEVPTMQGTTVIETPGQP